VFFQSKQTYLVPIETAAGLGILFLPKSFAGLIVFMKILAFGEDSMKKAIMGTAVPLEKMPF
jgi:hypothetical protein